MKIYNKISLNLLLSSLLPTDSIVKWGGCF